MFFWLTIVGGLLMLLSWAFDPGRMVGALGAVLFVVGVLWFFVLAFRTARRERIGARSRSGAKRLGRAAVCVRTLAVAASSAVLMGRELPLDVVNGL